MLFKTLTIFAVFCFALVACDNQKFNDEIVECSKMTPSDWPEMKSYDQIDKFLGLTNLRRDLNPEQKLNLFVDTDIGGFVDDQTAFAVVHGLVARNETNLLATVANTRYEGIVMNIDVMNTFFGHREGIPLGITHDPKAFAAPQGSQKWTEYGRKHFPSVQRQNVEAEDAVEIYRRVLGAAANHSVTILSLGHFRNLENLLKSKPDKHSPLNGVELALSKVKEVVAMAGIYPNGSEWNIEMDTESARYYIDNWPTKTTYLGFEIGNVTCGTKYEDRGLSYRNPIAAAVYYGYDLFQSHWGCYDAVAALVAGHQTNKLYCSVMGELVVNEESENSWKVVNNSSRPQSRYLITKAGNEDLFVARYISRLLDDYLPDVF